MPEAQQKRDVLKLFVADWTRCWVEPRILSVQVSVGTEHESEQINVMDALVRTVLQPL